MAAYQLGADFVVSKGKTIDHSGHSSLTDSGVDELLMAVSFLCFQREFINQVRTSVSGKLDIRKNPTQRKRPREGSAAEIAEDHRQFATILPRHLVSPYLQKDWAELCYIFKALEIYYDDPEILKEIQPGWSADAG
jgi:hypothetical protein